MINVRFYFAVILLLVLLPITLFFTLGLKTVRFINEKLYDIGDIQYYPPDKIWME